MQADGDDLDFEPENDMQAEEPEEPEPVAAAAPAPRIASKIQRGRGHEPAPSSAAADDTIGRSSRGVRGGKYDSLSSDIGAGGIKSIEGWVIFVTGIHQEAGEDQVLDVFGVSLLRLRISVSSDPLQQSKQVKVNRPGCKALQCCSHSERYL